MINVLVGALVGGVLNLAAYAIIQKARGSKLSWRDALGSFVGGAVGGALVGATFGAAALEAGGLRAAGFLAADGSASWVSERVTDNALDHRPIGEHVARDAAIGAIEAPLVYFGVAAPLGNALGRIVTPADASATEDAATGALRAIRRGVGNVLRPAVSSRGQSRFANALAQASQDWVSDAAENVACYLVPDPPEEGSGAATDAPATADSRRAPAPRVPPSLGMTQALETIER